ncbi:MAG: hypothetical protein K6E91_09900 [Butyrivibrio sp.]|nr:hypothetical protein [Butyrivibrio sp.]
MSLHDFLLVKEEIARKNPAFCKVPASTNDDSAAYGGKMVHLSKEMVEAVQRLKAGCDS